MPGDPRLRASDADRERTAELLREHHAVGRLTAEEFEGRLEATFAARTRGDLDQLLADLPAIDLYRLPSAGIRPSAPGRAARIRERERWGLDRPGDGSLRLPAGAGWGTFATVSVLLVAAWAIVGVTTGGAAWVPWFLLVLIPWLAALARRRPGRP
jgi:hypothetical protein